MSDDSDSIADLGPSPAPLPLDASVVDMVRVVNQLQSAEYVNRINRHKHRSQVNRVVDEVRDDLVEAVDKLTERLDAGAASQKRIERGLFGDEFGQKGMVHRLEALETAVAAAAQARAEHPTVPVRMPAEPTALDRAKTVATEWAIKIGVLIGILVLYDYGGKALAIWKAGGPTP